MIYLFFIKTKMSKCLETTNSLKLSPNASGSYLERLAPQALISFLDCVQRLIEIVAIKLFSECTKHENRIFLKLF